MIYSKKIINRFENPKFAGKIKSPDGTGKVGNPICGDIMHIYIKVNKEKIKDIRYNILGCVAAIAFSEELCRQVKGKTLKQAKQITNKKLIKSLGKMPSHKFHCSLLAEQALKKAIQNYEKK